MTLGIFYYVYFVIYGVAPLYFIILFIRFWHGLFWSACSTSYLKYSATCTPSPAKIPTSFGWAKLNSGAPWCFYSALVNCVTKVPYWQILAANNRNTYLHYLLEKNSLILQKRCSSFSNSVNGHDFVGHRGIFWDAAWPPSPSPIHMRFI